MAEEKSLQRDMQRIGDLVQQVDSIADPAARVAAKQLLQSLMDFHGAAFERALEIVAESGDSGLHTIDRMGRDSLLSGVLVLYGLHPDGIETRVAKAVEAIQPKLRKQGCELSLIEVNDGSIALKAELSGHTCGSTAKTVRTTIESAMYDAAPDLASLAIEGLEEKQNGGFVALDKLMGIPAAERTETSSSMAQD